MTFTQCWGPYTVDMQPEGKSQTDSEESMNLVFADCNKENAVYPLMLYEIAESQSADITMGQLKNQPGYSVQLIENTLILCKEAKLIISQDLKDRAVE